MSLERDLQNALALGDASRLMKVYEDIYDEFHGLVAFVVSKFVSSSFDREEIVEDTFLAFFNYEKKGEVKSIKYFLLQTAKNKCMDYLKRKEVDPLPEEVPARDDFSFFLDDLRKGLGEDDYELLYDYIVDDTPSEDLADRLGCTKGSLRVRIHRIKAKARKLLSKGE